MSLPREFLPASFASRAFLPLAGESLENRYPRAFRLRAFKPRAFLFLAGGSAPPVPPPPVVLNGQFWMKNGGILVDALGHPYYCPVCPCGGGGIPLPCTSLIFPPTKCVEIELAFTSTSSHLPHPEIMDGVYPLVWNTVSNQWEFGPQGTAYNSTYGIIRNSFASPFPLQCDASGSWLLNVGTWPGYSISQSLGESGCVSPTNRVFGFTTIGFIGTDSDGYPSGSGSLVIRQTPPINTIVGSLSYTVRRSAYLCDSCPAGTVNVTVAGFGADFSFFNTTQPSSVGGNSNVVQNFGVGDFPSCSELLIFFTYKNGGYAVQACATGENSAVVLCTGNWASTIPAMAGGCMNPGTYNMSPDAGNTNDFAGLTFTVTIS